MRTSRAPDNTTSSGPDVACTHCRNRKIRCGRERPRCRTCERDDSKCDYQMPGKRVNHMKLLSHNVKGLDGRLLGIENQISFLVSTLKRDACSSSKSVSLDSSSPSSSLNGADSNESDSEEFSDQYRGPLSLQDLWQDVKEDMRCSAVHESLLHHHTEEGTSIEHLMHQICHSGMVRQPDPHQQRNNTPRLPPKEHIMKAQNQFFLQKDWPDLFVHESFLSNLDRVYQSPMRSADEPWVICFKAIVLLVLGSELVHANSNSLLGGLAGSFLLPGGAPLVNSRLLTAPILINIQVLILLSVLAQQQESQSWSDMLLAQACMLAKTMKLHRTDAMASSITLEERQERNKVFRFLFIRDKELAISRGATSWLTDAITPARRDSSGPEEPIDASRLHLAIIQNKIYHLAHGSKPRRRSSKTLQSSLARIEDDLKNFALSQGLFELSAHGSMEHVTLQLAFLSTRMGALMDSSSEIHARQSVLDARASCIVLLLAFSPGDPDLLGRFLELVDANRTAYQFTTGGSSPMRQRTMPVSQEEPNRLSLLARLGMLHSFPSAAIFLMVRSVLSPSHQRTDSATDGDLDLIQKVYACYLSNASIMATGSYGRMLVSTLQVILKLVSLLRNESQPESIPTASTPAAQLNIDTVQHVQGLNFPNAMYPTQDTLDMDTNAFSAWSTPSSAQSGSLDNFQDAYGWQAAVDGLDLDINSLLLSAQNNGSSGLFPESSSLDPDQTPSWSIPFDHGDNMTRKKRRRTEDGHES